MLGQLRSMTTSYSGVEVSYRGEKMRRVLIVCVLLLGGALDATSQPAQQQPSFDCAKAVASIERAICADSELAQWDARMGQAFKARYARLRRDQRRTLLEGQRRWILLRNNQCGVAAHDSSAKTCILYLTKERVATLEAADVTALPERSIRQTSPAPAPNTVISIEQQRKNRETAEVEQKRAIANYANVFAMLAARNREADPNSITVDMSVTVTSTNPPKILGTTNLPDGTALSVLLKGEMLACLPRCGFFARDAIVVNSRFTTEIIGVEKLIPASYTIDIATPSARSMPQSVQSVLGKAGEHLYGPYVVTLEEGGKYVPAKLPRNRIPTDSEIFPGFMIHYTQKIAVLPDGEAFVTGCVPKLGLIDACDSSTLVPSFEK